MESLVEIADGKLRGIKKTNLKGEEFHSFLCIPYGKPPVGELRFKAPQPAEPWQGIKDATKEENTCFQLNPFTRSYTGSEDCLSLHVFTKKLPSEEARLKPVMVFIHGGGFVMGSHETNMYGPEYLMTEDIVLVTITYRVGFLGFLSLSDSSLEVPGNAGLKDQVLALKWVQKNIKHFNGDPNNVTIFGESAGSASTEFLVLSPSAKNLFHRAIMQSGSTLNFWTIKKFDAEDFASFIGKPNISEREVLNILRQMPVEELYKTQLAYTKSKNLPGDLGIVAPVIEKSNPTAFLTKKPIDLIQSGNYYQVPIIIGYNDAEGLLFKVLSAMKPGEPADVEIPIETMLPYETNFKDPEQVKKITEKIQRFYSGNDSDTKIKLITDAFFASGIVTSARNQAKISKHPVYLYRFSLETGLNFLKRLAALDSYKGACHADELGYLFKSLIEVEMGDNEKLGLKRMVTMWTNFAKYGHPTPKGNDLNIEWKPIENDQLNFLEIGQDLKMGVNPDGDRMRVWNEVYQLNPLTAKY